LKKKIAFFDVDKTLIERDSMYDLLFFTWKSYPASIIPSIFSLTISFFKYALSGAKDICILKEGVFYCFRYLNENDIKRFAQEELLKKRVFRNGISELKNRKKEGYIIALVSASPERYLSYFQEILPIDKIIGTTVDSNGKIEGGNCKHNEKVRRIKAWLRANDWEVDYENSVAYSDNLAADQPMLELVSQRYLINSAKQVEGYKNLYWEK
jgi:phosphatidylglycerophosphatase C